MKWLILELGINGIKLERNSQIAGVDQIGALIK